MVTQEQRLRVWEDLLSAEMRANYFADLAGAYAHRQRLATWLILFFSCGAFVTSISKLPPQYGWIGIAMPLVAAAISLYSVVMQNQKNAVDSSDLHFRWNKLSTEYCNLWDAIQADAVTDLQAQLAKLDEKSAEMSKAANTLSYSERRMLKWYDLVVKQHRVA